MLALARTPKANSESIKRHWLGGVKSLWWGNITSGTNYHGLGGSGINYSHCNMMMHPTISSGNSALVAGYVCSTWRWKFPKTVESSQRNLLSFITYTFAVCFWPKGVAPPYTTKQAINRVLHQLSTLYKQDCRKPYSWYSIPTCGILQRYTQAKPALGLPKRACECVTGKVASGVPINWRCLHREYEFPWD